MADDDDGPQILRPIPRRPFNVNFTRATPPDEPMRPELPNDGSFGSKLLSAAWEKLGDKQGAGSEGPSRVPSILNLTSSTLYGIYSPTTSKGGFPGREDGETPWGVGTQTPVRRPSLDEATYELMRERRHSTRRRSSFKSKNSERLAKTGTSKLSIALRTTLLFVLGLGYGALVTRFHEEQKRSTGLPEGVLGDSSDLKYLAFWGVGGVMLGSSLPWLDSVWEETFGSEADEAADDDEDRPTVSDPGTDWTLVMRAIGAFVGIVFAIRKLPWASTLQLSVTLALVNPLLWWLIDRSKPGFLLSAAVGLIGSLLLMGVSPDMMPTPTNPAGRNASMDAAGAEALMLGGLAKQETVETGMWMLSVLFCSCVCFGNIGRRLTWSRSAATKGRWAGVQ